MPFDEPVPKCEFKFGPPESSMDTCLDGPCGCAAPTLGVVWMAFRAAGIGRPKGTVLRMIAWYQANVSAGRNLCSIPAPYNCSNRMAWTINNYGLILGVLFGLPMFAHRSPRSGRRGCVLIGLYGLVATGACSDGPGDRRPYG
jgi:hypothetical protein